MLAFLVEAVIISLSGVMAPGPVTMVVIGKGNDSPHAGALVAIGHGFVEIPLMIAIFYGLGQLLNLPFVKDIIALLGGLFLLFMAYDMLKATQRASLEGRAYQASSILAGIFLTIVNPYFMVWWATVGATLIYRSVEYGILGFAVFASLHWLCDFGWDYALSIMAYRGGKSFGLTFRKGIYLVCGCLLIFFGVKFIYDGALSLFIHI